MKKVIMYEQIYKDIVSKIQDQTYKVGELIPSEKELAAQYQVSRITSNKAMNLLASQNLIERIQGKGSFVSKNAPSLLEMAVPLDKESRSSFSKINAIGVIIDTFGIDFGSNLIKSIESECRKQKMIMIFRCSYGNLKEENDAIESALSMGAKGLILMCAQGESYNDMILRLAMNKYPVVLVDREMRGITIPCIKTDNYMAAYELTKILISRGHKKICFVIHSACATPTIEDRCSGFRDCIMENQKNCQGVIELLKTYQTTPEDAVKDFVNFEMAEVKKIIQKRKECTAFFMAEYKMAVIFDIALRELGIQKEMATFDGLDIAYEDKHHFLHIKQDEYQMGIKAVQTLMQIINGETPDLKVLVPHEIVM